jgi:hypothetical protein
MFYSVAPAVLNDLTFLKRHINQLRAGMLKQRCNGQWQAAAA